MKWWRIFRRRRGLGSPPYRLVNDSENYSVRRQLDVREFVEVAIPMRI
jgi:hypothetical protein